MKTNDVKSRSRQRLVLWHELWAREVSTLFFDSEKKMLAAIHAAETIGLTVKVEEVPS